LSNTPGGGRRPNGPRERSRRISSMCDFTLRAQRRHFKVGAAFGWPGNQSGAGALAGTFR